MLAHRTAKEIELILRSVPSFSPFPPAAQRNKWKTIAANISEERLTKLMVEAELAVQTPIPPLPGTAFLDYKRTGQRERYNRPREQRRTMLATLVLAECLEGNGRFLDAVLDLSWAICEESTWATSSHQIELTDISHPVIDIHAAMTALELAEVSFLLGSKIDPRLSLRIRHELDRRCFSPYMKRNDFKWMSASTQRAANNWTAVCTSGIVGAALYVESNQQRLAEIVARAIPSLNDYLSGFDQSGGSSEGPGYWDFGFGYFVVLARLIEQRTRGQINFLQNPRISDIASYPLRVRLSPNRPVNFSDCQARVRYSSPLLAFLAQRFALPALVALSDEQPGYLRRTNLTWGLRMLFWNAPADVPAQCIPNADDWFEEMMWMISRRDPRDIDSLVLAAKGGNNGEMHNHNDLGNFIVHSKGESLIADIGRGRYTMAYFGPQRYEHLATSSHGHSVPSPNGCLQQAGATYRATLLDYEVIPESTSLHLELKEAYPIDAGVSTLRRRLTLLREFPAGCVKVEDVVRFEHGPGMLESVLITFGEVDTEIDAVIIRGRRGALRIGYSRNCVGVRVQTERGVDLPKGPENIRRVIFSFLAPLREGRICLDIKSALQNPANPHERTLC